MTQGDKPNDDSRTRDAELGMSQPITRRDLLQGAGVAVAGALVAPLAARANERATSPLRPFRPEQAADDYPPARSGLRGSHVGAFETAHERVWAGREWKQPKDLDEGYDLIVVSDGISGLAAAHFYRQV